MTPRDDDEGGEEVTDPGTARTIAAAAALIAKELELDQKLKDEVQQRIDDQTARRDAFRNAYRYAQQTKSKVAHLQFADGQQRWVIFRDGQKIACFPPFEGDLDEALGLHVLDGLIISPEEALNQKQHMRMRNAIASKLRFRRKGASEVEDSDGPVEMEPVQRQLVAGPPVAGEEDLDDPIFDEPTD